MFSIIDDVLPEPIFNRIQSLVVNNPFFNFSANKTFNENIENSKKINYNSICFAAEPRTEWEYQYFALPLIMALSKKNLQIENLIRIRFALFLRDIKQITNIPHIDDPYHKHFVGLYYLNETDGTTKIWKQKHKNFNTEPKFYNTDEVDLLEEVSPKLNRMVIFNGEHYHSSTLPTKTQLRYVINYNFTHKSIDTPHL